MNASHILISGLAVRPQRFRTLSLAFCSLQKQSQQDGNAAMLHAVVTMHLMQHHHDCACECHSSSCQGGMYRLKYLCDVILLCQLVLERLHNLWQPSTRAILMKAWISSPSCHSVYSLPRGCPVDYSYTGSKAEIGTYLVSVLEPLSTSETTRRRMPGRTLREGDDPCSAGGELLRLHDYWRVGLLNSFRGLPGTLNLSNQKKSKKVISCRSWPWCGAEPTVMLAVAPTAELPCLSTGALPR